MPENRTLLVYPPLLHEVEHNLYDVYKVVIGWKAGRWGTRYWFFEHGTEWDDVEAELVNHYEANDVVLQLELPF